MRIALPFLFAVSLASAACGSGRGKYGQPVHASERVTRAEVSVSEDAFPSAVRDLLASEPASKERQQRLAGVVARQMTRVASRFKARNRDSALLSLSGAMYLVRAGELTPEMLGPNGADALQAASDEYAKKGDEGRARAAYEMLFRIAPPREKAEIKAHLEAITAWTRDTGGGGTMQTAGALEAAAVTRLLLEPSAPARDDAVAKTSDFIEKAIQVKQARRAHGTQISREEGLEAVRALETGTTVLVAIHLRSGDAHAALAALEKSNQKDSQMTRPELLAAVRTVVDRPDSERWLELARMLRPSHGRGEEEDFGRDADLLRVASFVSACEAYRLDATAPEPAAFVAEMLVELGMGDAAPAVLADAVRAQKDPRIVPISLGITMQAIGRATELDEPDTARRAFRAAAPILAYADASRGNGKAMQPGPSRLYATMGEVELREGHLDEAKKLFEAAAERERSGLVMMNLARIDWHAGRTKEALDKLRNALEAEDVGKEPAFRAEILMTTSDILREQGDAAAARRPLADALRDLAKARGAAQESDEKARLELAISRVLDRFGAGKSAEKALDRSLEAAPRDKRQAAATIGRIVGRAFVSGDLAGARDGLARAQGAELGRDDIVYDAIQVRLLERQLRKNDDPTAERILAGAADDPRWIGKIAAFGAGKMKGTDLVAAAQTPSQKTEALFYAAMDRKAAGDAKGADDGLKQVVGSTGLEIVELGLARDILAGPRAAVGGPVPDVGLP